MTFQAKDGLFYYRVRLSPSPSCQCGRRWPCAHGELVLGAEFGLSSEHVSWLHHFYGRFLEAAADPSQVPGAVLESELKRLADQECGICLRRLARLAEAHECAQCRQLTHRQCIDGWAARGPPTCIYCRAPL